MINAQEDKAGMPGSIESVAYELGGVLGVATLGSILSFTYTKALVLPQGLPAPALAKDSLDQALLPAEHLSGDATVKLVTQARLGRRSTNSRCSQKTEARSPHL
jgi:DHA2 family multidrug resistance protein-like MFS transporter